jgi:hypothetical protein
VPIFTFPDDAAWNEATRAVEFSIEIGEYTGLVSVPRQVFQALLPMTPRPELCIEAYHLDRARFERAAQRKIETRQLTADGNVELTLKDLRDTCG